MSLLLLGGTADAKRLATALSEKQVDLVYSVAGLVRQPQLDCAIISGGFSRFGGLPAYLATAGIDAILDATHPYASHMSDTAVAAARSCGIPIWRYQRPAWRAQAGDEWQDFASWTDLPALIDDYRSIFFSAGQLPREFLDQLGGYREQRQLLRTATRPAADLPASMTWIEAIGPFELADERCLFETHDIDLLVSKNSGGEATAAKLRVARERGVPVLLLRRPTLAGVDHEFADIDECCTFVFSQLTVSA